MEYKTVGGPGDSEVTVKKSLFIGAAFPVAKKTEAEDIIASVKAKHKNARHNTSAYILTNGESHCSDDGEPQGTAGVPILEALKKRELRGLCVVVTRYFGGILLGTGGLIRAYSSAAAEAVGAAGIVTMQQARLLEIKIKYPLYGKVNYELSEFTHRLISAEFEDEVSLTVAVKAEEAGALIAKITETTASGAKIREICEKYLDFKSK